uniref:SH2 domain-containing protein n=1 Tax=Heterorhabditis bacteriophora TaxID=37862 RepID=A0A1I7XG68_HETBA
MTAVRDNLCELGRMEIPRPQFHGMQFVATRGRQGFYKVTIRENGSKYGLQIKPQGPRRPILSSDLFQWYAYSPTSVKEEDSDGTVSPTPTQITLRKGDGHSDESSRSSQLSNYSSLSNSPSPFDLEPDYPNDYVPPHLRNSQRQINSYKTRYTEKL